jgi:hypothetical protein
VLGLVYAAKAALSLNSAAFDQRSDELGSISTTLLTAIQSDR